MKKIIVLLFTLVLILQSILVKPAGYAEAATTYITIEAYAKNVAKELGLKSISGNASSGYVNALLKEGIIKEGEYSSYTKNITRADALVIINRADEYLYGDKVDKNLVQLVIEKRISDITKIKKAKREDVAKAYIKGYMKGYSNGTYSQDREIRGTKKITKDGAKTVISFLKNKKGRAKISPDGQLLRTTNLPNNAYMYPYILASFPNRYYEGDMMFEGVEMGIGDEIIELTSPEYYTYPVDVGKSKVKGIQDTQKAIDECADAWMDKVKGYMETTLKFDYRTVSDEWIDNIVKNDLYYGLYRYEDSLRKQIEEYIKDAKKNKSIVECDKVALDKSSLYFFDGAYYVRCYVKYRIVSCKAKSNYTLDELLKEYPYKGLLWSRNRWDTDVRGYKLGKWREEIYDVEIGAYAFDEEKENYGIGVVYTTFAAYMTAPRERH